MSNAKARRQCLSRLVLRRAESPPTLPVLIALVFIIAIQFAGVERVLADLSSTPRADTWYPNSEVFAISPAGSTIYIAGAFDQVMGTYMGSWIPIDARSGAPAGAFPKVNDAVYACIADGSGGWYISGEFSQVGSFERHGIAHILSDGTVDPDWDPWLGYAKALAVSGSILYIGGHFSYLIGEKWRYGMAAIDTETGAVDTNWVPSIGDADSDYSPYVNALAVSGSTVYVGGKFTSFGGQPRNNLAALDARTGKATDWNPKALGDSDSEISAITVSGSVVYVGGCFTTISGETRNNIVALDAATGTATAWNPDSNDEVSALAVSGSTVYVGGSFTSIGRQTRNSIAALDAATGFATDWNPNAIWNGVRGLVSTLAVSGSTVYAGGLFTSIGAQSRNNLAALDDATGMATDWNPSATDEVSALAVSGSTVYAGGRFMSIGGQTRSHIAAFDTATGAVTGWNPSTFGTSSYVFDLAVSESSIYVSGWFTNVGGKTRNSVAALDAKSGVVTDWNPNPTRGGAYLGVSHVWGMAASGSTVYAVGDFTSIGGQARNGIAALDAITGAATGWNPNATGGSGVYPGVYAIGLSDFSIYFGGDFTGVGGKGRNNIAEYSTLTGEVTDWDPNASGTVTGLAVSGSTIYVWGEFTKIGGKLRNGIAALDADTGMATAWNPNPNGKVWTLAVSGSAVYAAGGFTSIGGKTRNRVAALDPGTGAATTWIPSGFDDYPYFDSLAASESSVYLGGGFDFHIGDDRKSNFAQFDAVRYNVSTRGQTGNGGDAMIAGFIIDGAAPKTVTVTGWGPTLSDFGVTNALADPTLEVFKDSNQIGFCDNWRSSPYVDQLTNLHLAPKYETESAVVLNLAPGEYTAILGGVGNTGLKNGIVAVWDCDEGHSELTNISTRGWVGTGNDQMIAGFIITGETPKTMAVTAWGPTLRDYGVTDYLPDPMLTVCAGSTALGVCDDWKTSAYADQLRNANLAPKYESECGVVLTLNPGEYTAILSGFNGTKGNAIVAVWAVGQ